MDNKSRENRCKGTTKHDKPCRAAATEGGLCFFHANPNKAAELGRIGGRTNGHSFAIIGDPPSDLVSAKGVMDAGARLIEDVYAGKISPRVASCLAPLLNFQIRAIHFTDIELRLAKLEQCLNSMGSSKSISVVEGEAARGIGAVGAQRDGSKHPETS